MFYIKLNGKTPVDHPLLGDNLKTILEVSVLTDELLVEKGYARYEASTPPDFCHVTPTTEYFLDTDGVVRNKLDIRPYTQDELIDLFIRRPRSFMLATSDWTQTLDSPLSPEKKAEWAAYRAELRDLTNVYPNVQSQDEVVWPTIPA